MKTYNISETPTFTITWLSQTGEEQSVVASPTITIKRYNNDTTWTTLINAAAMTNVSGSTYYYEMDLSAESAGFEYQVLYNATIDTLDVSASENFRTIDTTATQEDIKELRTGNIRYDFTIATEINAARNVEVGYVDSMTIYTKEDSASDWSSPTSTKTLYFWYDTDGNCIARKEEE